MEDNAKVFSSDITVRSKPKNYLNEILNVLPATPVKLINTETYTCDFRPKTGKNYIPKTKTRLKVKTVRDIRKSFEQDVYSHLITDLERQESILFKKLGQGSSRDTKAFATNILRGDTPITRSTWQMLINLNPESQKYPRQFVLWNRKYIQVNGSYGGVKEQILNYDLASKPQCIPSQNYKKKCLKQHEGNIKKRRLRNSSGPKPGPLCKKQFLNNSLQRHHFDNIELIHLPKPKLDIQPKYGTTFESSTTNCFNNLLADDGTISQKWAEKSKSVQLNRDCVTFDLSYKYNKKEMLMRRDVDHCMNTSEIVVTLREPVIPRTVEINLIQDKLVTQDQELKNVPCEDLNSVNTVTNIEDKLKRKFDELDGLDVTDIMLPGNEANKKRTKKYVEKHAKIQNLTVVALKLNCDNIEFWCMVHKLYKCFCKGKFTNTYTSISNECVVKEKVLIVSNSDSDDNLDFWGSESMSSSRTRPYEGRNYRNGLYNKTNYKISIMEKNDRRLQERLSFLYSKSCTEDVFITKPTKNTNNKTARVQHLLFNTDKNGSQLLPQSKIEMRALVESLFKVRKLQKDTGLFQDALEPPRLGMALYSWDFILRTFREKKHIFLVYRQAPHRVYIAVNTTTNPYFDNCVNVNDIQLADVYKYPEIVKYLINANHSNDNFCILKGLLFCWEIVGIVKREPQTNESDKYAEQDNTTEMKLESSHMDTSSDSLVRKSAIENTELKDMDTFDIIDQGSSEVNNLVYENTEHETLTVFNHTLEIRDSLVENMEQKEFQDKKGSNQNKLEVNKSSLENMEQEDLQNVTEKKFESNTGYSDEMGSSKWLVMAIENDFIELRLEKDFFVKHGTITEAIGDARLFGKTKVLSKKCVGKSKNPRFGIYVIPNYNESTIFIGPYEMEDASRIEIIKTISSDKRLKNTRCVWITTNKIDSFKVAENPLWFVPLPDSRTNRVFVTDDKLSKDQQEKDDVQNGLHIKKTGEPKECSPPKKRKTGDFYHVASDDVLKKKSLQYPHNVIKTIHTDNSVKSSLKPIAISNNLNRKTSQDQYAEASSSTASQIKISAVFSKQNGTTNPDLLPSGISGLENVTKEKHQSVDTESSTINGDICVITDVKKCKTVWIECINILNLGWIAGIRNFDNFLSFKIPKCEYSDFYEENTAFNKINVELGKRINALYDFEIQWTVHESIDQVQGEEMNAEKLFPNYVADENDARDQSCK